MIKKNLIFIFLLLIKYSIFCQETSSWKSYPAEYESIVQQHFSAASDAWSTKNFDAARAEYSKVIEIILAPPQYRSYARLRIAQSYIIENDLLAARTEYEKIKSNPKYPEVHRFEAVECIKGIDRMLKGLPPVDTLESRTEIKPVTSFAVEFFISPDGSDSNPGTLIKPFATIEKARDTIQVLKTNGLSGHVAVNLLPGEYPIKETFTLKTEDSGTSESLIVYRAYQKGTASLYGGKKLTDFKMVTDPKVTNLLPYEAKGKVYQCNLKKLGIEDYGELTERGHGVINPPPTMQLFFNGEPMTIARWPNEGFVNGVDVIKPGSIKEKKPSAFKYHDSRHSRWTTANEGWIYGFFSYGWADRTLKIFNIDTISKTLTCGYDTMRHEEYFNKGKIKYFAFNMLEEIDVPGEWYVDRKTGILYFYPPSDPASATIETGTLKVPMLSMEGVSNVRFEGIVFDLSMVTCMTAENCNNCLFAGCIIKRFASDGMKIEGGRKVGIFGCDIYYMGRGCVEMIGGDRETLTPANHFVENCRMYSFGLIDHTYVPGVQLMGVGNRIAHNFFHDSPSSVIRLFGNDHVVEYNKVKDALQISEDQGAMTLFGDPTFRGIVFRYNLFSNLVSESISGHSGRAGIRLDDAISGVLIYGNIFFKASQAFGGININGGRDNIIDNNIFVECNKGITGRYNLRNKIWSLLFSDSNPTMKPYLEFMSDQCILREKHDLYLSRYPDLNHVFKQPADNFVWRTVFWNTGPPFSDSDRVRIDDFNIMEIKEYSDLGSPFADVENDDFTLKYDAPFFDDVGFRNIPTNQIGIYNHPYRAKPVDE